MKPTDDDVPNAKEDFDATKHSGTFTGSLGKTASTNKGGKGLAKALSSCLRHASGGVLITNLSLKSLN
jgi:hypothetical protein